MMNMMNVHDISFAIKPNNTLELIILIEKTYFFQATINLIIGYEPPASSTPNLNNQPNGDMTQVDAGKYAPIHLRHMIKSSFPHNENRW